MWVGWVDIFYGWMEMGRVSGGIFLIFCVGGHFLWKSEGREIRYFLGGVGFLLNIFTPHSTTKFAVLLNI